MSKQLVLLDHDGGVDDYLATALLLTMEHVETIGVVVTPADCFIDPAVSATRKLLDLMGRSDIPVAESTVRGLNPFPREWRNVAFIVDHLPILNDKERIETPLVAESGQDFMVRVLKEAAQPVTLLVTGPLTTVAVALDMAPEIEGKIKEILWMGGALEVPGNVSPYMEPDHDGSAEWNVYWDPPAAHRVWATSIPIVLCPLDITNNTPVTAELIQNLGNQRKFPVSDFAAHCYALVMRQGNYYFWDVLTTAYLGRPQLFTVREQETAVIAKGRSRGRTKLEAGGRKITVMDTVQLEPLYKYIVEAWAV